MRFFLPLQSSSGWKRPVEVPSDVWLVGISVFHFYFLFFLCGLRTPIPPGIFHCSDCSYISPDDLAYLGNLIQSCDMVAHILLIYAFIYAMGALKHFYDPKAKFKKWNKQKPLFLNWSHKYMLDKATSESFPPWKEGVDSLLRPLSPWFGTLKGFWTFILL